MGVVVVVLVYVEQFRRYRVLKILQLFWATLCIRVTTFLTLKCKHNLVLSQFFNRTIRIPQ